MKDPLIWCYRHLGPIARRVHLQKSSRWVYNQISSFIGKWNPICEAEQNGRVWKLHRDVAERGVWQEFATVEWLRSVCTPGATVVDVGANVGQMTLEMAALVGPHGRVIAIEPAAGNVAYLRDHIAANGFLDRVTVIEAACSDVDGGTVSFFLGLLPGDRVGSGHSLLGRHAVQVHDARLQLTEVAVPRVSLDGVCSRLGVTPSIVKVDVEGAEHLVLRGGRELLSGTRPAALRVAFHPFAFSDVRVASFEFASLVRELGYEIQGYESGELLGLEEYVLAPLGATTSYVSGMNF